MYNALAVLREVFVLEKDSLNQRIRDGLLLDAYGPLLTEKQRLACELVLINDLSLAEAAESLEVSRQGVHDLVARSREHMEELESSLRLIEKDAQLETAAELLENNKELLPLEFYIKMKETLKTTTEASER